MQWVYKFGDGQADGTAEMRELLGGKGANLAEMCHLGLPVPPGITISTEACNHYYAHQKSYPDDLKTQVEEGIAHIGKLTHRLFADETNPLLVSVRSGARASMPGMMDTVLNLGLNDMTVEALAAQSGDKRFAYDCYRRFIQMYGDVVMEVPHDLFEDHLDHYKGDKGYEMDGDLSAEDWQAVVGGFKKIIQDELDTSFPQDPHEQLWGAIGAVFSSWMNPRAMTYRQMYNIPAEWGTAVTVQAMVFGNMGDTSATGVAFTRNPSTGQNELYGEFLVNAQGEDVVAGIRTPQNLTKKSRLEMMSEEPSMEETMPDAYQEFVTISDKLENHYKDMQDIEFSIEKGKLWILQTRAGKRTSAASIRIAVDLVENNILSEEEAVLRVEAASLEQLLHSMIDPNFERNVLTTGLPASPGAAVGEIVFDADEAERRHNMGIPVLLTRLETSPEDIHGMHASQGILTARGGMTSHAAVVARGMGKPCICGASQIQIDFEAKTCVIGGQSFKEGDTITMDGGTGEVMAGAAPLIQPELTGDFSTVMDWADKFRRLKVRANAETALDTKTAISFGAEGIGLCRTEHMFFQDDRITAMRRMIIADNEDERRKALDELLPMQRNDFQELFEIMEGRPVTIRLLDPPLHEFLPHSKDEIAQSAQNLGVDAAKLQARLTELEESNPMLGHRGCRLMISYPEVVDMQARAIFSAALDVKKERGEAPEVEIMVPLVALEQELKFVKARIDAVAQQLFEENGVQIKYIVGTMIELPRAALTAAKIANHAAFFSFGTNDLTQTVFGLSRDDAAKFLDTYFKKGILEQDPFVSIDKDGVCEMIKLSAINGRKTRPDIKLGVCGEQGGDPVSIELCEQVGLDYVSCSAFRVPIARLAAAQAAIRHKSS